MCFRKTFLNFFCLILSLFFLSNKLFAWNGGLEITQPNSIYPIGIVPIYSSFNIRTPYILSSSNGTEYLFYASEEGLFFACKSNSQPEIMFNKILDGDLEILDAKVHDNKPVLLIQKHENDCKQYLLVFTTDKNFQIFEEDLGVCLAEETVSLSFWQQNYALVFFSPVYSDYGYHSYEDSYIQMKIIDLNSGGIVGTKSVYECSYCIIDSLDVENHNNAVYVLFASRTSLAVEHIEDLFNCSCEDESQDYDDYGINLVYEDYCQCDYCEENYDNYYWCHQCNCNEGQYYHCDCNGYRYYNVYGYSSIFSIKLTDPLGDHVEFTCYHDNLCDDDYDYYYDYYSYMEKSCDVTYDEICNYHNYYDSNQEMSYCDDSLMSNSYPQICYLSETSEGPCDIYDYSYDPYVDFDYLDTCFDKVKLLSFNNSLYFSYIGSYNVVHRGQDFGYAYSYNNTAYVYDLSLIPLQVPSERNWKANVIYLDSQGLHIGDQVISLDVRDSASLSWTRIDNKIKILFTDGYKLYYLPLSLDGDLVSEMGELEEIATFRHFKYSSIWYDKETSLLYVAIYDNLRQALLLLSWDPVNQIWQEEIIANNVDLDYAQLSLLKSGNIFYLFVREGQNLTLYFKENGVWSSLEIEGSFSSFKTVPVSDNNVVLADPLENNVNLYLCGISGCNIIAQSAYPSSPDYIDVLYDEDNNNILLVAVDLYGYLSIKSISLAIKEISDVYFSKNDKIRGPYYSFLREGNLYFFFIEKNGSLKDLKLALCQNNSCNISLVFSDIGSLWPGYYGFPSLAFSQLDGSISIASDYSEEWGKYKIRVYNFTPDLSFVGHEDITDILNFSPDIDFYQLLETGYLVVFHNYSTLYFAFWPKEGLVAEISVSKAMSDEYHFGLSSLGTINVSWSVSYNWQIDPSHEIKDCLYFRSDNLTHQIVCLPHEFSQVLTTYSNQYNGTIAVPKNILLAAFSNPEQENEIIVKNFIDNQLVAQKSLGTFRLVWIEPIDPSPANGSEDIDPTNVILSWSSIEEAQSYKLYIWREGETPSQPVILNTSSYQPEDLAYNTTYYWQVVAVTDQGEFPGEVWHLSTTNNAQITAEEVSGEYYFGDHISLEWSVQNTGQAGSLQNLVNCIYLSQDNLLGSDRQLTCIPAPRELSPGESYHRAIDISIPSVEEGDYYIIITNKINNQVVSYSIAGIISVSHRPLPDLVPSNLTLGTDSLRAGDTLSVEWQVTNEGEIATDSSWIDSVWLSPDGEIEVWWASDDIKIGEFENPAALQTGESYTQSVQVNIPFNIAGDYYIVVKVNDQGLTEGATDNNFIVSENPIHIEHVVVPTLVVVDLQVEPSEPWPGETVTVSWALKNIGDLATGPVSFSHNLYLSKDDRLDWNDRMLLRSVSQFNGNIAPGETTERFSVTFESPWDIWGEYYLFVEPTVSGQVSKVADKKPITLNPGMPADLVLQDFQFEGHIEAGRTIHASWTVTNEANEPTHVSRWVDEIILSQDNSTETEEDNIVLQRVTHYGVLHYGESYTVERDIYIPQNFAAGSYYVFLKVDSDNRVYEADYEDNNINSPEKVAEVVFLPPDLRVVNVSIKRDGQEVDVVRPGDQITFEWQVENSGDGIAPKDWWDGIYLSSDNVFENDRYLSGSYHSSGLEPNETYTSSKTIRLPIDLLPGDYTVFICADSSKRIVENSDENNCFAKSLIIETVPPDLYVKEVSIVPRNLEDGLVDIRWIVRNSRGVVTEGTWVDKIYLSQDKTLDENDNLLGEVDRQGSLNPNQEYLATLTDVNIPLEQLGSSYILVVVDAESQIAEANEDNNIGAKQTPAPVANEFVCENADLYVNSLDSPSKGYTGQSIILSWQLANGGEGRASKWYDAVYLSLDPYLDKDFDIYLGSYYVKSVLNPGETLNVSEIVFKIPENIQGEYYVILVTDTTDRVCETEEANNVYVSSDTIEISPPPPSDLVVTEIEVPASAYTGDEITIRWKVENRGEFAAAGAWRDAVYLSKDSVWDLQDQKIGEVRHKGEVSPGSFYEAELKTKLGAFESGSYFVIIRTDIKNEVKESEEGETNNIGVSDQTINVDNWPLVLDEPQTKNISSGEIHYYKIENVPAGETLKIEANCTDENAVLEVFVAHGYMPNEGHYDFIYEKPFWHEQRIVIPETENGTYYVMVKAPYVSGNNCNYTISAKMAGFEIYEITPDHGGNTGFVTVTIKGSKLDEVASVRLVSKGNNVENIFPKEIRHISPFKLLVKFDLKGVPLGEYTLKILHKDSVEVLRSFFVETGRVDFVLLFPASKYLRADRKWTIKSISLQNAGNIDIEHALLYLIFDRPINVERSGYISILPSDNSLYTATAIPIYNLPVNQKKAFKLYFDVSKLPSHETFNVFFRLQKFYLRGSYTREGTIPIPVNPSNDDLFPSLNDNEIAIYWLEYFIAEDPSNNGYTGINHHPFLRIGNKIYTEVTQKINGKEYAYIKAYSLQEFKKIVDAYQAKNNNSLVQFYMSKIAVDSVDEVRRVQSFFDEWSINNYSLQELERFGLATSNSKYINVVCAKLLETYLEFAGFNGGDGLVPGLDFINSNDNFDSVSSFIGKFAKASAGFRYLLIPQFTSLSDYIDILMPVIYVTKLFAKTSYMMWSWEVIRSNDPNSKEGYADDFISDLIPYTIYFENKPTASAPAQKVIITDKLDPNLDWRTLQLGEIHFSNSTIEVPGNRAFYVGTVDLENGLKAKVQAKLDIKTGTLTWTLEAIDPETGEAPEDPMLGLLPPNDPETHVGEGYVTFYIKPKKDLPTGTKIINQATIVFDNNEPIDTNTVFNTIDSGKPISSLTASVETTTETSFELNWSGEDDEGGSGIKHYEIYVAVDDEPYSLWQVSNETSAVFEAEPGHTYKFYSLAEDNVGNREEPPAEPDAVVTVLNQAPDNPEPASGAEDVDPQGLTLSWQPAYQAESYDLFLWKEGEDKPSEPIVSGLTETSVDVSEWLEPGTTYHWQVVAHTSTGDFVSEEWIFVTSGPVDADDDGLPDEWELYYFGSLEQDANGDFDGDGLTNLEEYQRGTDPTTSNAPSIPQIIAPEDGAEIDTFVPTFTVRNSVDPDGDNVTYECEIYTDEQLNNLVASGSQMADQEAETTSWSLEEELSENTWYYWRVRATDGHGYSQWAYGRFFVNTENEAPGEFHILEPVHGATVDTLTPLIKVSNALDPDGDAVFYRFEIYTDEELKLQVANATVAEGEEGYTSWQVPEGTLAEDASYYVRVVAFDEEGLETPSETVLFTVNTANQAPSAPQIVSPEIGSEVGSADITLEIQPAEDPDGDPLTYFFELDVSESFDTEAKISSGEIDNTSWEVTDLLENTWYYWRVRASDGEAMSPWTVGSFFVNMENDPPAQPQVVNPGEGAEVEDLTPVLEVTEVTDPDHDAVHYRFEVYADAAMENLILESETEEPRLEISQELQDRSRYYWRACAVDEHGLAGEWTPLSSFLVNLGVQMLDRLVLEVPEGPVQAGLAFRIKVKALDQDGQLYEAFEGPVSLSVSSGTITPETLTSFVNGLWDGQVIIEGTTGEVVITAEGEGLSAEAAVEVTCAAPAAPSLVWPEDNSTVNQGDMSFTWGAVEGAESYEIEVAADSGFNEIRYSREGITTSFVDVSSAELSLEGGVTYYWRVRAVSECGEGAWSKAYTFSVPEVEPQITITSPADGATLTAGEEITITWDYQGDVGDTVKIRYNTGGRRWSTIATGVPVTDSSYLWTVPNKATTRLRIKIESEQDRTIYDIGGFYTIEIPE